MPIEPDDRSEIDWFILHALVNAERDDRISNGDLGEAGTEAMTALGLTLEQYGRSLRRLDEGGLIEAEIKTGGDGRIYIAVPLRVTAFGMRYAEDRIASEVVDESGGDSDEDEG